MTAQIAMIVRVAPLDTGFHDRGWAGTLVGIDGADRDGRTLAVQTDGRILMAGWATGIITVARFEWN